MFALPFEINFQSMCEISVRLRQFTSMFRQIYIYIYMHKFHGLLLLLLLLELLLPFIECVFALIAQTDKHPTIWQYVGIEFLTSLLKRCSHRSLSQHTADQHSPVRRSPTLAMSVSLDGSLNTKLLCIRGNCFDCIRCDSFSPTPFVVRALLVARVHAPNLRPSLCCVCVCVSTIEYNSVLVVTGVGRIRAYVEHRQLTWSIAQPQTDKYIQREQARTRYTRAAKHSLNQCSLQHIR